jgi:hypothetical protein
MALAGLREVAGNAAHVTERGMALDHDHCFLCGVEPMDQSRTDEHAFRSGCNAIFNLWTEDLNLLNGSTLRYAC